MRPKKKHDHEVRIRLTGEERRKFQEVADAEHLPLSTWMRWLAQRAVREARR